MKYLCLAYGDPKKMAALSKAEFEAVFTRCKELDEEMRKTGQVISATSLEWAAASIRPRNGKPFVTDGPFIETSEQVGGLFIIEARDLNDAIRVASMHPAAILGDGTGWGVEVHPIADGCHQ
jgi:hypothetical protein